MKLINILFPVLITFFSCSKDKDLSGWNTDRRGCADLELVSKRFTINWQPLKDSVIRVAWGNHCGADLDGYKVGKLDTIIAPCSIDKIDSSFRIEVRGFEKKK